MKSARYAGIREADGTDEKSVVILAVEELGFDMVVDAGQDSQCMRIVVEELGDSVSDSDPASL